MSRTHLGWITLCIACFCVSPALAEFQIDQPVVQVAQAVDEGAPAPDQPDGTDGGDSADSTEPEPEPEPEPTKQEYQGHAMTLWDGSRIVGEPLIQTIVVHTDYGTLKVPTKEIVKIVPGLRNRPDFAKQIDQWIANLSHEQFPLREKAQQELIKQGPAIRDLLEPHRHSPDAECKHRIAKILAEFNELTIEREKMAEPPITPIIDDDRVVTQAFTIVGQVDMEQIKVRTGFGEVGLAFSSLSEMSLVKSGRDPVQKNFTITYQFATDANDKNTGIRVQRGDRVVITASGQITMSPWSSSYKSSPEGMSNCGWFKNNEIAYGALTGKIGSGEAFKVGTRHTFTANRSGLLKLGFAITSNYNSSRGFPGQYEVRVRVEPGEPGK